jgi:hypothetical protein
MNYLVVSDYSLGPKAALQLRNDLSRICLAGPRAFALECHKPTITQRHHLGTRSIILRL